MTYTLEVVASAARYLGRLDVPTQRRFHRKFQQLRLDPFSPGVSKPLVGRSGARSARVGDWRLLFSVDVDISHILIEVIAPRGEVYR